MHSAAFLTSLFSLHIFQFSMRCQCCTASSCCLQRSCVKGAFESLLAAPDSQLNTGTFGWKIRLSLRPQETFHVKLFKLFRQNRLNFFENLLNRNGLPVIHGANMEASVDFDGAKIDRVKPKVKQYLNQWFITSQRWSRLPAAVAARSG